MIYIVYSLHIITCLFLIMVVLLQQGKGADLSVFGGGTTQAAFGARGAATVLHKLTVGFFVLFMVTTVSIGVLQRGRSSSSVMQGVETTKEEPGAGRATRRRARRTACGQRRAPAPAARATRKPGAGRAAPTRLRPRPRARRQRTRNRRATDASATCRDSH